MAVRSRTGHVSLQRAPFEHCIDELEHFEVCLSARAQAMTAYKEKKKLWASVMTKQGMSKSEANEKWFASEDYKDT